LIYIKQNTPLLLRTSYHEVWITIYAKQALNKSLN